MIARRPSAISWPRYLLIGLAGVGLTVLLMSYFDQPASSGKQPEVSPIAGNGAAGVFGPGLFWPIDKEAPREIVAAAHINHPPPQQPSAVPFKFLGKLTDNGQTSVLLYGRGRTLTVRAPGPIDDDYVVDDIQEDYLVLRHVQRGESQMLELASRQPAAAPVWSAEDTPQD